MSFLAPMFVGEVASLLARVVFTSDRSIEVVVSVQAEDLLASKKRTTNTAVISFVPYKHPYKSELTLPCVVPETPEEERLFQQGEERLRHRRNETKAREGKEEEEEEEGQPEVAGQGEDLAKALQEMQIQEGAKTPAQSRVLLSQLMLPSDCSFVGFGQIVRGGVILKLMDNAAGVTAGKHCMSNVVTACVDSITFLEPLHNGGVASIEGQVVFTGTKSLEVLVTVYGEELDPRHGSTCRKLLTTGLFTFVSLDPQGKTQKVPQLRPETEEEMRLFLEAQSRYNAKKGRRSSTTIESLFNNAA